MKKTLFQIFWPLVFLLLLIFSVIFAKTLLSLHLPKYSPQSQVCYFPSEASLQYILSSRIANGESLPDTLTDLQYPEGIKLGEEITVFQEYVCGWSYRFLVSPFWEMDFFLYALIFIAISSSLPILVIYLFGEVVLEHRIAALAGALLYGLCPLTFTRVIGNFGRENFALTFVFLPTILFLAIWKNCDNVRKKHFVALGLFAAFLSQLIAFASWHLSRFVFTLEMGILFLLFLTGILSRKQAFLTGVWVILLIPFTVIIPCLRANLFIFSPGIIVGGYFFISYYLNKKKCKKIHHYTLFFILMVVGIIFSNSTDSHVTTVIIDKLKHFLIKPESPELLAPESRMMWIEAFLSPPLYRIVYYFVPLFPLMTLSSIGAIKYWKQNTAFQLPLAIITLNTLIFGCFYLLFERMHVFFTFYLFCFILIGIIMYCQKRKIRLITSITILTVILSAAQTARVIKKDLAYSFLKNTFDSKDSVVPVTYRQSNLDLIDWIEEETSPDQTFAGWIGIATWIYSYAQRPVLIHSKFENKKIRNKTLELLNALYTT